MYSPFPRRRTAKALASLALAVLAAVLASSGTASEILDLPHRLINEALAADPMAIETWAPGTPAHSWQAVACGGTEMGTKGMLVAAKAMTLTAIDLLQYPEEIKKAKAEFDQARGDNFIYEPLLGNREPALNYRD